MFEMTARLSPRTVALSLVKTTALDEAARHAREGRQPSANWEMYHDLTATLESWQRGGSLREDSLLLMEWLAVEMCAYLLQQLGDRVRVDRWLREFGDQVCQAQRHVHPAGPTAIEILGAAADDLEARPPQPAGARRLARIGASYLPYLRADHEVKDAREMALTIALWAGSQLAALTRHDAERITSYMKARDLTTPRS